ncbi:MAG TPA: GAF domain-containing SpoIIE family protein phosphatase [Candidatus Sulfotelmatobacter sp.]|jgi:sigma-B regulation protein RsbU (phosphoserine phosphatase)|nr:GAF domain-containing SpoIIE family protein phosphatase [Candidatus Sulfotelmatobacter sp.]
MAATPNAPFNEVVAGRALPVDLIEDLQRVQKAAQRITSILDLDQLLSSVVQEVTESFGCLETSIYLHDERRGEMVLSGVRGCTLHHKGHRLKIGCEGMVGFVAANGQMRYAPDVRNDQYYVSCEESTLSEVAIPLHVGDQLVGVFTASHPEVDGFPRQQLRILQALCDHIAVAIHNARRLQSERAERADLDREAQEARAMQQALLPKSSPYIPGFAVSGLSVPARAVGGDWYDFIPFPDGRWGLVLADVSGKGTAAALLMSATRGVLRSLAEACCTPGEVLTRLNQLLVDDFPAGKFVTMVYAVLDPSQHTVTFANAGHLRPLFVDHEGEHFLDTERGLPLGLSCGDYSETQIALSEGSKLVFYSDGITEAENASGEEYGLCRLSEHAAREGSSAVSIVDDVRGFVDGASLRDDASVVFVGVGR